MLRLRAKSEMIEQLYDLGEKARKRARRIMIESSNNLDRTNVHTLAFLDLLTETVD